MSVASISHRVRLVEWQAVAADRMAPLVAEEADRWQRLLDWDTAPHWAEVEARRRRGAALGFVAMDDAANVRGWCHYSVRDRGLRLDALNADNDHIAEMLLDRLLTGPALTFIERISVWLFTDQHTLTQALRARGLSVDRYWWLGRELNPVAPPALQGVRQWRPEDSFATAALLGRAYESPAETRPFAPLGTPEQWFGYLNELTRGVHGTILPEASLCVPAGPDRLSAVAIVTKVNENTAHIAQLVVDAPMRRKRLGQQLMQAATAAAARAGCRRVTAVVGGSNRPARSLFEGARYQTMGSLLAAGMLQPRRSTSVAPPGVSMTRR
ncbi:MAG: GNAT family N-acetyltransferase [Vicinamibacterales bacterium]